MKSPSEIREMMVRADQLKIEDAEAIYAALAWVLGEGDDPLKQQDEYLN